ncbi:MAG: UPF0182 family protein, partial [Acidobacteriaceae bacterium]
MPQPIIDLPRRKRRPRRILFLLIAALILAVFVASNTVLSYYVQILWFGSLGYAQVFWKSWGLEWSVCAVFFAATFILLYGWFLVLWRMHQTDLPQDRNFFFGGQAVNLPLRRVLRWLGLVAALVIGAISGATMMAEWPTFALYRWAPAGGAVDPVFGKPLSFYLFTLPAWQLITGWLLAMAVIACVGAVGFLLVSGSSRALARERDSITGPLPWHGSSIAFAFFLVMLAAQEYISRFTMLLDEHTIFSGVNYTEAHVLITGKLVVAAALVIGAAIAAVNSLKWPKAQRLVVAVAPAVVVYLAVQVVGWYVSSFIVKPNQLERERPFIARNIEWTRQAWGLDRLAQQEFPAETTADAADPAENQATLKNIRLWDWRALQDTLRQIQEIRTYYDFPDIDIDRYTINGENREVMLAARELNIEKLPESSRNW